MEKELQENEQQIKLPKNIRQVGTIDRKSRIYMEDYVVTYLKQIANAIHGDFGAAALYGNVTHIDGTKYVFVSGAVFSESNDSIEDGPYESMLLYFKEIAEEYFDTLQPVGVAVIHKESVRIPAKWHKKINLCGLLGRGEVFVDILKDSKSEEYAFVHEDGIEIKDGHFIYYDKNEAMQNFLVEWHEHEHNQVLDEISDDISAERDEIISSSCRMLLGDKKENHRQSLFAFCSSASSIMLLVGMCAVGVLLMNHYSKTQNVSGENTTISTISQTDAFDQTSVINLGQAMNEVSEEINANSNANELTLDDFKQGIEETSQDISNEQANVDANNSSQLNDNNETYQLENQINSSEMNIAENNFENVNTEGININENSLEDIDGNNENYIIESDTINHNENQLQQNNEQNNEQNNIVETSSGIQNNYDEYQIERGDTLFKICMRRYGNTENMEEICIINNIENPDSILYGQTIELPHN